MKIRVEIFFGRVDFLHAHFFEHGFELVQNHVKPLFKRTAPLR